MLKRNSKRDRERVATSSNADDPSPQQQRPNLCLASETQQRRHNNEYHSNAT